MLILSRKVDEKIKIGNDISIQIIGISGDQVKIGVDAPKTVKVFRQEVYDDIQRQNQFLKIFAFYGIQTFYFVIFQKC